MNMQKPGQLKARTSNRRTRSVRSAPNSPLTVRVKKVGFPILVTLTLDPSIAGEGVGLATYFAHRWVRQYDTHGLWGTAMADRQVLRKFFAIIANAGVVEWSDITVDFLLSVEVIFNVSTGYPSFVWTSLRGLPTGTLDAQVEKFVQSPPHVSTPITRPTEAMPPAMLRDVLRQAMRDVTRAEARIEKVGWNGTDVPDAEALLQRHEVTAFFLLLCMEWSQSPDVIADLSFDPSQPTSVQGWHEGDSKVTVRWHKNRGGANGVTLLLADKPWRAGALLRRLHRIGSPTRFVGGASWSDSPWAFARTVDRRAHDRMSEDMRARVLGWDGRTGLLVDSMHTRSGGTKATLRAWCEFERIDGRTVRIDDSYLQARARLAFRSIRPAAKWARFTASGGGLLLSELVDDNTIEVLSAHYLNSEVAMRDIGAAWAQVPTLAEEVARGLRPTAVDKKGGVVSGPGIDDEERERAIGPYHVGIAGCRDPFDSPLVGERRGCLCAQANRSCFTCPNAVVSPDDIPSLLAYLQMAEAAHAHLPPPEWELHWGQAVRWIRYVLPLLDPHWADIEVGGVELFDMGLQAGPA